MLHSDRIWSVAEVASAEELAADLTETTWCCCQAFQITGHPRYIWLNDSTSPDGAQEYAVCRLGLAKGDIRQIETITFGWCDSAKALKFVKRSTVRTTAMNGLGKSPPRFNPQKNMAVAVTATEQSVATLLSHRLQGLLRYSGREDSFMSQ